jgi:hypothetical protein
MFLNLKFPSFPFIFRYIQWDYDNAKTTDDLIDLFHKWKNKAESTNNTVKRKSYETAAVALYSEITKRSYCTKQFSEY